jgi:hypothetical protein
MPQLNDLINTYALCLWPQPQQASMQQQLLASQSLLQLSSVPQLSELTKPQTLILTLQPTTA